MAMEQEPRLGGAGSENFRSKNAGSVCECTGFVHIRFSGVEGGARRWQNNVMDRRRNPVVQSSLKLNGCLKGCAASRAQA
ncbi:hypothetical protein FNV43_RR12993 [Rhamnella rubrinervis]|uniref:Uncharacterized protein n=1 Tax=Rhamnella rubrinervis TaxID=2594499 RepID=A0A8K0H080_9ROSA|nr:hypothetical protein FNV43_RR12993 [Rhamnella rubrinervis]